MAEMRGGFLRDESSGALVVRNSTESKVDVYPGGGAPAGGAQQFKADYSVTSFLKRKTGEYSYVALTEGVWIVSTGVIVNAAEQSQAWGAVGHILTPPPVPPAMPPGPDSVWDTFSIDATDITFWPTGFTGVDSMLQMHAPVVVPAGQVWSMMIAIGADRVGNVITARQTNAGDQYIRAARIGSVA